MSAPTWSRRKFLATSISAAGGLLVAFHWDSQNLPVVHAQSTGLEPGAVELNAFVEIAPDGTVTILAPVPEIGQGVRTALPMIVADELEVEWSRVRVRQASSDSKYGGQSVGGSDSVADYWEPLRNAGATARELLITAAAQQWGITAAECYAEKGRVYRQLTGESIGYGEVVGAAAGLPVPDVVPLKSPDKFRIIGKRIPSVDLEPIVRGQATYGLDVRL